MAGETPMTLHGFVQGDPVLRFTPKKTPAVRVLVATPSEVVNRESGRWVPGPCQYTLCTALGRLATDMAEVLEDGTPVIVSGYWQGIEGDFVFLDINDIALSLREGLPALPASPASVPAPKKRGPIQAPPQAIITPLPNNPPAIREPAPVTARIEPNPRPSPDWWVEVCASHRRGSRPA
jgi:hypothetical protein